jgi:hypothetical protein
LLDVNGELKQRKYRKIFRTIVESPPTVLPEIWQGVSFYKKIQLAVTTMRGREPTSPPPPTTAPSIMYMLLFHQGVPKWQMISEYAI